MNPPGVRAAVTQGAEAASAQEYVAAPRLRGVLAPRPNTGEVRLLASGALDRQATTNKREGRGGGKGSSSSELTCE